MSCWGSSRASRYFSYYPDHFTMKSRRRAKPLQPPNEALNEHLYETNAHYKYELHADHVHQPPSELPGHDVSLTK
jgi:hypothetical protein